MSDTTDAESVYNSEIKSAGGEFNGKLRVSENCRCREPSLARPEFVYVSGLVVTYALRGYIFVGLFPVLFM